MIPECNAPNGKVEDCPVHGSRFAEKRMKCRHDNLRGIYGDEIHASGGKRSQCMDCFSLFASLPGSRNAAPALLKVVEAASAMLLAQDTLDNLGENDNPIPRTRYYKATEAVRTALAALEAS